MIGKIKVLKIASCFYFFLKLCVQTSVEGNDYHDLVEYQESELLF